jgi:hypothetical protein
LNLSNAFFLCEISFLISNFFNSAYVFPSYSEYFVLARSGIKIGSQPNNFESFNPIFSAILPVVVPTNGV